MARRSSVISTALPRYLSTYLLWDRHLQLLPPSTEIREMETANGKKYEWMNKTEHTMTMRRPEMIWNRPSRCFGSSFVWSWPEAACGGRGFLSPEMPTLIFIPPTNNCSFLLACHTTTCISTNQVPFRGQMGVILAFSLIYYLCLWPHVILIWGWDRYEDRSPTITVLCLHAGLEQAFPKQWSLNMCQFCGWPRGWPECFNSLPIPTTFKWSVNNRCLNSSTF